MREDERVKYLLVAVLAVVLGGLAIVGRWDWASGALDRPECCAATEPQVRRTLRP